jgi:hypothetical protein
MKATYVIRFTPALIETMFSRFRRLQKSQSPAWLGPAFGVGLLATAGYGFYSNAGWTIPVLFGATFPFVQFFLRNNSQLDRWRSQKALLAQPNVTLELTNEDILVSAVANARIPWSGITAASRFPDGFILTQKGIFRWLPDDALTGATVDQVTDLLRTKISTYKDIQA